MTTLGEALVHQLRSLGVTTVFGIPGVHTVELYRGLTGSGIRHVTPRHEQGAGFMADGYARVSGQPGVAFVITGPGLTNMLTPMAQARADSVPMLVISGVNALPTLGKGLGYLHELPDQRGLTALVALTSTRIEAADDLPQALGAAFASFGTGRPGPVHIEIPTDVMGIAAPETGLPARPNARPESDPADISRAAGMLAAARSPVILAGGGAKFAGAPLARLAERLGAPVVQTANARGTMHAHPLTVPASPCLAACRALVAAADVVLAVGTEFGPTEYDMYGTGPFPLPERLVRIDISTEQLGRHPATVALAGDAGVTLAALDEAMPDRDPAPDGAARAAATRGAALAELSPDMRAQVAILDAMRAAVPGAIMVGDSTQVTYGGNLYYDHDRPAGWFNAATGYGALGLAIPAAIGAALAAPGTRVLCLTGDGGAQFTLPELMTAVDERLPITFMIWNNRAYQEIATSMAAKGVPVLGCDPTPPDFAHIAKACGMPHLGCAMTPEAVADALRRLVPKDGPVMIEIDATL
ncbi:MAG: 5-guanidino-2-oxopentanoate decarboxylase [Rhodobacteraceae bacterium]|nr:5-guanidino-2-oxopentanoate decarboxylase [Paracoccaceae bacterium]